MKRNTFFCTAGLILLLLTGCTRQQSQMSYIGTETAKQVALDAASLSAREVSALSAEMSNRNGLDYYQISFASDGQSYQYEVDALTGVVINPQASNTESTIVTPPSSLTKETQIPDGSLVTDADSFDPTPITPQPAAASTVPSATPLPTPSATPVATSVPTPVVDAYTSATTAHPSKSGAQTGTYIGEAEAKRIALEHAGLSESQVTLVRTTLEQDHGRWEYDVEFYTADYKEYDYEIDANTGTVISYDYDAEYYAPQQSGTNTISAEDAKRLALDQVPGATNANIHKFKTDYDDGMFQYEGEIIYNGMEYEFEIDAYSGSIRKWSYEPMWD